MYNLKLKFVYFLLIMPKMQLLYTAQKSNSIQHNRTYKKNIIFILAYFFIELC